MSETDMCSFCPMPLAGPHRDYCLESPNYVPEPELRQQLAAARAEIAARDERLAAICAMAQDALRRQPADAVAACVNIITKALENGGGES